MSGRFVFCLGLALVLGGCEGADIIDDDLGGMEGDPADPNFPDPDGPGLADGGVAAMAPVDAGLPNDGAAPADAAPSRPPPPPPAPVVCSKRVHVLFAVYTYMGKPVDNGCWNTVRTLQDKDPQGEFKWRVCGYSGGVKHPTGTNFVYDDTNPFAHNLSTERSRILACAADGGQGIEYMAYHPGLNWRRLNPANKVSRYFAELYSSEYTVQDGYGAWNANRSIGAPMINLGHINTTEMKQRVRSLCNTIGNNHWIGFYQTSTSPYPLVGARLAAFEQAMNACTR